MSLVWIGEIVRGSEESQEVADGGEEGSLLGGWGWVKRRNEKRELGWRGFFSVIGGGSGG